MHGNGHLLLILLDEVLQPIWALKAWICRRFPRLERFILLLTACLHRIISTQGDGNISSASLLLQNLSSP